MALTAPDPDPAGRDVEGPAVAGHRARTEGRRAIGWAVTFLGITPLIGHILGGGGVVLTLVTVVALLLISYNCFRAGAGYKLIDAAYLDAAAEHDAAPLPTPAVDDELAGLGLHLARPAAPAREPLPEPHLSRAEARRVAALGEAPGVAGAVIPGSAVDVLTNGRGNHGPAASALDRAVRAFGVGESSTDAQGRSVWEPHLTLHSVTPAAGGDAEVRIRPTVPTMTDADLQKIEFAFLREARLASATPWQREVHSGLYLATVTTRPAPTPRAAPAAEPTDDPSDWL